MTAAASLLFVAATAAGLGTWFPIRSIGGRMFLGAAAIPLAMHFLHFAAGVGIAASSVAVAIAAVPGLLRIATRLPRRPAAWLPLATHPALLLPLAAGCVFLARGVDVYTPYSWDEFASWLHWPREAFVLDTLRDPSMQWRTLGYTQGWPLALVYPQILSASFSEARVLPVGLVWHAAMLALAFDAVSGHLRRHETTAVGAGLSAWLALLVLLGAEATWTLLPQLVLIEPPQIYMLAAMIGFFLLASTGAENRTACLAGAGLALAAGYLTKVTVLGAVPAAALMAAAPAVRGGTAWRPREAGEGRALAIALLCALGPVAAVWLTWPPLRSFEPVAACLADPFTISLATGGSGPWQHVADAAGRLAGGIGGYLAAYKTPLTVVGAIGLAVALCDRRRAPVAAGILLYAAVYVAALLPLYAFCYGAYELDRLDSLQRYLRVPLRLVHLFGPLFLMVWGAARLARLRPDLWTRLNRGRTATAAIAVACLAAGAAQVVAIDRSVRNVIDRYREPRESVGRIAAVAADVGRLQRLIAARGLEAPRVAMIAQGSSGFELRIARYHALGTRRGGARFRYRLDGSYSWGESPRNQWMHRTAREDIARHFRSMDMLWPLSTDDWMRGILRGLVDDDACADRPESYFLVRTPAARHAFECVPEGAGVSGRAPAE